VYRTASTRPVFDPVVWQAAPMSAEIDVYKEWLGIPEGPRPPDHYTLLRLKQFEDAADKIRANYKKLNGHVRKYATGQYSDLSQDLLNELAKAMLCLTDSERKRDYDKSQGREYEEVEGVRKSMDLLLIEQGAVSESQAKEARQYSDRMGLELRDAFVQLKMVDATIATQAMAQESGLSFVDLGELLPEDEVLDMIPRSTAKQNTILPLFIDDDVLLVACATEIGPELEQELRMRYEVPIRSVLAAPKAIEQGIAKYYAPGVRNEASSSKSTGEKGKAAAKGGAKTSTSTAEKAKAEKANARAEELRSMSPEERKEEQKKNKMVGLIIICWSAVAAYLIQNFLFPLTIPGTATEISSFMRTGFVIAVLLLTTGVVSQTHWRK